MAAHQAARAGARRRSPSPTRLITTATPCGSCQRKGMAWTGAAYYCFWAGAISACMRLPSRRGSCSILPRSCRATAKRLMMAMQDNVAKFEQKFGPIEVTDPGTPVH